MLYLVAFCRRPETASNGISDRFVRLIVPDTRMKCCYPRLDRSPEIRPEVIVAACSTFSNFDKCRPETAGAISGVVVDWVGTDSPAKFGAHRLNGGRNI